MQTGKESNTLFWQVVACLVLHNVHITHSPRLACTSDWLSLPSRPIPHESESYGVMRAAFIMSNKRPRMSQFQRSIETTQRDLSFPAHHSSIEDLQLKRQRLKVCCESGARKRESGVQTPTSHPTVDKGMKKDSRWHPSWIHPR